jgi:SOS-response transcriptional repressor LexA/DNA-binding XRE family transcriptional regulator
MPDFDEKAVINRIIKLREDFAGNRSKSKFAKLLGISASTYNYYEKGRLPPVPVLLKICEVTSTNLYWLLTGHYPTEGHSQDADFLTPELATRIKALLKTSPESVDALCAFIELLTEKKHVENQHVPKMPLPSHDRPEWIPIIGRTAAGMLHFWQQTTLPEPKDAIVELDQLVEKYTGRAVTASVNGEIALDLKIPPLLTELKTHTANLVHVCAQTGGSAIDDIVQFVQCPQIYQFFPDAFALQIDGDSMSPRINDTDIVVLSPSVPAAQGQIAVAKLKDQIGVTCKLIRTTESHVHLIPINEKYPAKTLPREKLLWALAVLCHIRI